jgi:hypothetical protein
MWARRPNDGDANARPVRDNPFAPERIERLSAGFTDEPMSAWRKRMAETSTRPRPIRDQEGLEHE